MYPPTPVTKRTLFILGVLVIMVSVAIPFLRSGSVTGSIISVTTPPPYVVPFVVNWDLRNTGYDSNPRCEVWDPRGTDAMVASFNGVTGSYTVSEAGVSFILRCFKGTQYFDDLMPSGIAPSDSTSTTGGGVTSSVDNNSAQAQAGASSATPTQGDTAVTGQGAASSVGGQAAAGAGASLPAGSIAGPSVCDTVCGDGIKAGDELCDDGNAINTDACNNNCGRMSSSSSSSSSSRSFNFSSSSSSVMNCIPGTICPTGDICPQNGVCPMASSSSSSSSVMTCIPGTICPTGGLCPQNGFCPQGSSSSSQGVESCTINADCPSNLCLGGFCSCTGSEQCGGNACVGGFCANIPASNDLIGLASCTTSSQCPTGMLCQNGYCAPDLALCGNGIADAGEVCDDGNDVDIDGCTATCLLSDGAACTNPRQCRSLICKEGVCTPCVSDTECPDDMACVEGACTAVNPLDPDNDGMVVLSDGYKIAASLFSQLGSNVRPENLSYEDYLLLMQQHAAGHAPVGSTGPESVAIMAAGASAGYAWMKMRKMKKGAR